MSTYGYSAGQPFGDPSHFSRSTGADELDRFNQWLRAQPWWQQIKGSANGFGDAQKQQLIATLRSKGITVPSGIHVDDAGNFNESRTAGDWAKLAAKGAAIGGAAVTGLGAAGIGPMAGLFGGTAAAEAGASAIPALEGGGTLAANLGAASALPALEGAGAAGALGAGAAGASAYLPPGAAADAAAGGSAGAAAASGSPMWQSIAKLAGAAGIPLLATHHGNTGTSGTGFSNQQTTEYINQLLQMATQRAHEAAPVHQAAMQLAMSMQPNWSNPRIADANSAAMTPPAPRTMDPQVAEAYARLMGNR
jgi:hypothetical protein